jgi:hypothetical protein
MMGLNSYGFHRDGMGYDRRQYREPQPPVIRGQRLKPATCKAEKEARKEGEKKFFDGFRKTR